ncbi:MAG: Uma2 family endonuclease [Lachnospiraceae bacterium]|nr:Uma2 family endonuclease [Lachnospiraceae bacterium]
MPVIQDMANAYIEHSMVINNFVTSVGKQLKDSTCRVFGDGVKYKWAENDNIPIIPDCSINCDIRNRRSTNFLGVPRFIMEVLSESTEERDRNEKMALYLEMEVSEYWLVDWRLRKVEIYIFTPQEDTLDDAHYVLADTVTEENKDSLYIHTFPHVKISWDELFDL